MTASDVTLLWVDHVGSDWVGVYLDGEKVYEGPSVEPERRRQVAYEAHDRVFPSDRLADLRRMRGLPSRLPREVPA